MVTAARATTWVTAEQFWEMSGDGVRRELWRGVVVEMSPVGGPQPWIAERIGRVLNEHAPRLGIGRAWGNEAGFVIGRDPDAVLAPDVVLVPATGLAGMTLADRGFYDIIPPLVVEVKSPSDTESDISAKLAMYLSAGVGEVWWVRPQRMTLTRYRADAEPVVLGPEDTLDGGELLPGLSLPVGRLFVPPTVEW